MNDFWDFTKLLPRAIERYNMTRETRAALVCKRFRDLAPEIMGKKISDHVEPKYFKSGTLVVAVRHSAWAQYVYVHRHDIIMKMNLSLEHEWVKDLRTVVETSA
jgi:hypothetical protein